LDTAEHRLTIRSRGLTVVPFRDGVRVATEFEKTVSIRSGGLSGLGFLEEADWRA